MTERARVDEQACASEPIHLCGAIQPHGYLISCSLPDWTVRHASANVFELFELTADDLVGRDLRDYVADDVIAPVSSLLHFLLPDGSPQGAGAANIGAAALACDVGVHLADGLVHLELEPRDGRSGAIMPTVEAQAMIAQANSAIEMEEFLQHVVEQVRQLSGYDRVMVYRFRHDDAGEVVAEARDAAMEPYLGLRFPSTDIPSQARALYVRNRIRVIPDIRYLPVPVVPGRDVAGKPLDLSQHALRSVSPVHLEYLRNMGISASMSISIIVGGRLWGLVACHHRTPRRVALPVRAALDMFGMFVSMRVGSDALERAAALEDATRNAREALAMRLGAASDVGHVLENTLETVLQTVRADGVALCNDGRWSVHGDVPDDAGLARAQAWMQDHARDGTARSEQLDQWGGDVRGGIAGVLGMAFGRRGDWLLFFRREELEEVVWAGDPSKPMVATDDGLRIAPRHSFACWRETVSGRSRPWAEGDVRAATQLRRLLQQQLWQPLPENDPGVTDMELFRRRHVLLEQKSRLDQLGELLDGMGHLGSEQTGRIGAKIAELEAELLAMMRAHPSQQA